MHKPSPSKKGFTLLEVLAALVIVSIGITSLLIGMTRCLVTVKTIHTRDTARHLLTRVELENPLDKKTIEAGSDAGDFEDEERFRWHRTIEMVDEEERPGLFLVTTRVEWSQQNRAAQEEVVSYCYAPEAESVTEQVQ